MAYEERKKLIEKIEKGRGGRTLISLCNFDRASDPPLPGLATQFHAELKECLYRILKESPTKKGIDLFLYTRGGDTNSVWPIASLLREFDEDFEVLVPFRAHSAGTMLALAAKRVVMTRLGELSPIDPTTGNQFNPVDALNPRGRLGISVEDVRAYREFLQDLVRLLGSGRLTAAQRWGALQPFLQKLVEAVHPLALGNVHRVHQLVSRLAKKLMGFHPDRLPNAEKVVKALTVESFSHQHMIGRAEARDILGAKHVVEANPTLESQLDDLLKRYTDDFHLRNMLFAARLMQPTTPEQDFRFIGGVVESRYRGYVFETRGKIKQQSKLPPGVAVQIPPGQPMPLIPGLSREFSIEIHEQRWYHNIKPEGVTT